VSVLDHPLWASLTTLHRSLAVGSGDVLRYPPEVAPFLAAPQGATIASFDGLVREDETVLVIGPAPGLPTGWRLDSLGEISQMVCDAAPAEEDATGIVPLGERERPDVLELTALVYPHYFRPRTMDLGRYFGIFERGRLAAMIGERMGMPGFRELSAVCTHPDFTGRGLARRLLAHLGRDLHARGTTPFLHVAPSNARAIELYERNGYRTRRGIEFWSLRRA
jgi:ribosomal protein S18 acetylase RimI-like enzyme